MVESIAIAPFLLFLLCHLVGDYILQNDWIAMNKNKSTVHCLVHCLIYTACFTILTLSWKALLFIFVTHFIIDRFSIITKRVIWLKNHINPGLDYPPFKYCDTTGYYDDSPYNTYRYNETLDEQYLGKPRHFFITIWLYIITDNTFHFICNGIALLCLT